jgi:uncharacterized membrane protein
VVAKQDVGVRNKKKRKRSAEQRANRKARKAERTAKKRALRQAAARDANAVHNPPKSKKAILPDAPRARETGIATERSSSEPPVRDVASGSVKRPRAQPRTGRERSTRSRIAIGVLLALGLMLGFWLLFRLPSN